MSGTDIETLDIARAALPETYEAARTALAECERLDECKDWGDKAGALASYARQARDDALHKMALRIQARAIRRAGELLKEFDARGDHRKSDDSDTFSRRDAAKNAGLSKRQQVTAVRVANVPERAFEAAVESGDFTVTQLAEQGKAAREPLNPYPDAPPAPQGFVEATRAIGRIREFAEFCEGLDPAFAAAGVLGYEIHEQAPRIATVKHWLDRFERSLKGNAR